MMDLNVIGYEHDRRKALYTIDAINSLVPTSSEISRRGKVRVNDSAPLLTLWRPGEVDINLERVGVEGSIDIGAPSSLESEGKEARLVVIPVILMPYNVRGVKE